MSTPPLHAFWDRPELKDYGDDGPYPVYQAVGASLTVWELTEEMFSYLFQVLVQSESHAALRAYGGISSTSGRKDALLNAAEVYFVLNQTDQELQEEFSLLLKHYVGAAARRNEIAHGKVISLTARGDQRGNFLYPSLYNSRKTSPWLPRHDPTKPFASMRADYRYTSIDIHEFGRRFMILLNCVQNYLGRLSPNKLINTTKLI